MQKSYSADNVIQSRGLKPSDRHDPSKLNFIKNLTSKILHFDMVSFYEIIKKQLNLMLLAFENQRHAIFKNNKLINFQHTRLADGAWAF